jgi:hypothetical protein
MYPRLVRVRQNFPADEVAGLSAVVRRGVAELAVRPGSRVAVAVGSRGVSPLRQVVSAILAGLRDAGATPFVVPAMGSHGGGTAEGQRAVLAGYGIVEDVVGGVALVENAYDRPCRVAVVGPERFHETDQELLIEARRRFPRIPLEQADLVIVDEMGKNITGTGMDPNVIGMWRRFGGERVPDFARVAVLGLSEGSHGNANGIGLADFTTRRLVDAVDWRETYLNALTALDPGIGKIPVTLETDRECVETALDVLRRATGRDDVSVVRVKSTLELAELRVSEGLVPGLPEDGSVEVIGEPEELSFDEAGRLR